MQIMIPSPVAWIVGLLPIVTAQSGISSSFWVPNFSRLRWPSSVVVDGTKLVIDGGQLVNSTILPPFFLQMASTILIDLTVPWTNLTVQPTFIDKPNSFPCASEPYIWFDSTNNTLYAIGGAPYYAFNVPRWQVGTKRIVDQLPSSQKLWQISRFPGQWRISKDQPPKHFHPLALGNGVATESSFFALGGVDWNNGAWGNLSVNPTTPGLVKYDYLTSIWANMSANGYGDEGAGGFGRAIYTRLFGSQGVIIYIGGYTPSWPYIDFHSSDGLQDMSQIRVYDIASGTFMSQSTTGPKPASRWGHCIAGVSEADTGTLDIFVHGGTGAAEVQQPHVADLGFIYVLSLPSFVWIKIPGSETSERFLSTCQVIGNRQMVIVGGDDPTAAFVGATRDPWANGIGIFDMSMLRWSSSYDSRAAKYKRADIISKQTSTMPYPKTWDSPKVQKLFNPGLPVASDGKSKTAAIAGGVVAGIVGLAVIIFISVFLCRRRRKEITSAKEGREAKTSIHHELHGQDKKLELVPSQYRKTGASGGVVRFVLDADNCDNKP